MGSGHCHFCAKQPEKELEMLGEVDGEKIILTHKMTNTVDDKEINGSIESEQINHQTLENEVCEENLIFKIADSPIGNNTTYGAFSSNCVNKIPNKNQRKISKNHSNNLNVSKTPLEVIKEINGEISKDSFREIINTKNNETENVITKSDNKENHYSNTLDNKKATSLKNNTNFPSNLKNDVVESKGTIITSLYNETKGNFGSDFSSARNSIQNTIQCNLIKPTNESQFNEKLQDQTKVENSKSGNSKKFEDTNLKPANKQKNSYVNLLKKIVQSKDTLEPWRAIQITTLIPEQKLLNSRDDEMLFQGDLYKYMQSNEIRKGSQHFSSKFCIITKTEFKVYRSKEVYLRLQNPMLIIKLFNISSSNLINVKYPSNISKEKNKKYYHFYIDLLTFRDNRLNEIPNGQTDPNFDISLSKIGSDSISKSYLKSQKEDVNELLQNTFNISNKDTKGDTKKINIIEDSSEIDFLKSINLKNQDLMNPNILLFASDNEDIVNKWLCVINYFIK